MQYSFPLQDGAVAEQVQELVVELQMFPLNGLGHDTKCSEQRHSPSIGSQRAPVFLLSQELKEPHLQIPSTQVSPATLQSDTFWPLQCISIKSIYHDVLIRLKTHVKEVVCLRILY